MHIHREVLDALRDRVATIIAAEESITLARLRDELGTSRRYAQALLEALDSERVTLAAARRPPHPAAPAPRIARVLVDWASRRHGGRDLHPGHFLGDLPKHACHRLVASGLAG